MKFISLTAIKIDGNSVSPQVIAFANTDIILPTETPDGTFFKYRDTDDLTKIHLKTFEVAEDLNTVINRLNDVSLSEEEKLSQLVSHQQKGDLSIYGNALSGDMILNMNPKEITQASTSDGWTQEIILELLDSKGNLHNWYSGKGEASIINTSLAGSASIDSESPQFLNGRAKVIVNGSMSAWVTGENTTLIINDLAILGYTIKGNKTLIKIT